MLSKVIYAAVVGLDAVPVEVEVDVASQGLPFFTGEFPEFPRNILESLRQPIEDTAVSISRANGKTTFLERCMLIASQNPCPCGYLGDNSHRCICTPTQISRYRKKISEPLLDRIDIYIDVPAVKVEKLTKKETACVENSQTVRARVQGARDKQNKRYQRPGITSNTELTNKAIKDYCNLSPDCIDLLRQAVTSMSLSRRAYYHVIKLSRTIADLEDIEDIQPNHIAEALQDRPKGEIY